MELRDGQTFAVRLLMEEDAAVAAGLLTELGYPSDERSVRTRLAALEGPYDRVFIAVDFGDIVGLASVHLTPVLHADERVGRVTALVVRSDARSRGIGASLVASAEEFAREAGCRRIEVTSGNQRRNAHAFYEAIGYRRDEQRFIKTLDKALDA